MSSSKAAGCTFELTATERFSYAASTKRKHPSAASGLTGSSPISSTTISRALRMACTALVTESSARWRRTSTPSSSRLNQATLSPASTASCPSPSRKNVLPVPEWAAHHQVLVATDPLERAQRTLGRRGDRRETRVPGVEGLARWKCCPRTAGGQRRALTPRDLLAEEHLEHFGWIPALRPGGGQHFRRHTPHIGQMHAPQQQLQFVWQRRRRRAAHEPESAQAEVPVCKLRDSSNRMILPGRAVAWWRISWARSSSANRSSSAAVARPRSTGPDP